MATTDAPATGEAPFSLALTQDQRDVRDWVHGFAEKVVRPAAAEWDEREETPWPVIQEAASIGLYGFEAIAQDLHDLRGHLGDPAAGGGAGDLGDEDHVGGRVPAAVPSEGCGAAAGRLPCAAPPS